MLSFIKKYKLIISVFFLSAAIISINSFVSKKSNKITPQISKNKNPETTKNIYPDMSDDHITFDLNNINHIKYLILKVYKNSPPVPIKDPLLKKRAFEICSTLYEQFGFNEKFNFNYTIYVLGSSPYNPNEVACFANRANSIIAAQYCGIMGYNKYSLNKTYDELTCFDQQPSSDSESNDESIKGKRVRF